MKKTKIAIIYDFDKTLCTEDMQNYSFIPKMGMTPKEFWGRTTEFSNKEHVEKILSYMYVMLDVAKEKNIPLTKKFLNECGKNVKLFPGVDTWFKRINAYGKERNIIVEHYLCSSGNKEIVEGCQIYKEFKAVFGCEFLFDSVTKEAKWPKNAINYTQKTQYIFRISKGALDISDDDTVNKKVNKRAIEMSNMIYLGDGLTDIPCMVLMNDNSGASIAIAKDESNNTTRQLLKDKRVHYVMKPNYKEGSRLENIVKSIIDKCAITTKLHNLNRQYDKKKED